VSYITYKLVRTLGQLVLTPLTGGSALLLGHASVDLVNKVMAEGFCRTSQATGGTPNFVVGCSWRVTAGRTNTRRRRKPQGEKVEGARGKEGAAG
jgi:hypothetical protein